MVFNSPDIDSVAKRGSVDLFVVLPVYNEEVTISHVIEEWLPHLDKTGVSFAILALNDASRDGTWATLQELEKRHPDKIWIIDKPHGGHGLSCRMGYDIAAASSASWVLQIDSDGQCDPVYFLDFWKQREQADCLFGVRRTRADGGARTAASWVCSTACSLLTGTSLVDANVPYRLIRTAVLREALPFIPHQFNLQNIALTVTLRRMKSVRWIYLPIHFRAREGGVNSLNLPKVAGLGVKMLIQLARLKGPN